MTTRPNNNPAHMVFLVDITMTPEQITDYQNNYDMPELTRADLRDSIESSLAEILGDDSAEAEYWQATVRRLRDKAPNRRRGKTHGPH